MKKVFILGAGGFARTTLDIYVDLSREGEVLGYLEDNCKRDGEILNGKPIRDVSHLNKFTTGDRPLLIAGIGTSKRRRFIEELEQKGYHFDKVVHPSAIVSRWMKIGEGSIVTPGVIIGPNVEIGRHVILNYGCRVSHDDKIGNYVTISPGAEIMGSVTIGDEVFVGVNATVIEKLKVGKGAIIGAGAVVTEDVPEMSLVAGVPAKVKKAYKSLEEKPW